MQSRPTEDQIQSLISESSQLWEIPFELQPAHYAFIENGELGRVFVCKESEEGLIGLEVGNKTVELFITPTNQPPQGVLLWYTETSKEMLDEASIPQKIAYVVYGICTKEIEVLKFKIDIVTTKIEAQEFEVDSDLDVSI